MLLSAPRSALLVVDIQAGLLPVMADPVQVEDNAQLLLKGADRLGIPVLITEQYPKGLGHTQPQLLGLADQAVTMEKIHFSCAEEAHIRTHLAELARPQLVIAGIEAHICVLQTAIGLKQAGYDVFVVEDACSSRKAANHRAAMERMRAAGLSIVTTEMVLFEWLHRAGTPEFKDISRMVK